MSISPLRDLLGAAMQRARVSTQVTAAQIVSVGNEMLARLLTPTQQKDARVVSYRESVLTLELRNASAAQFLKEQEDELVGLLRERFPTTRIRTVRYHVVHQFKTSEL